MEQQEFHSATSHHSRQWVEIEPKIHEMVLNSDSTGRKTLLQEHEPGSLNAKESLHDYIEEIYIIEGDLVDYGGKPGEGSTVGEGMGKRGVKYEKGWYAYRKPGMVHGPFGSEGGCVMFITITHVKK